MLTMQTLLLLLLTKRASSYTRVDDADKMVGIQNETGYVGELPREIIGISVRKYLKL